MYRTDRASISEYRFLFPSALNEAQLQQGWQTHWNNNNLSPLNIPFQKTQQNKKGIKKTFILQTRDSQSVLSCSFTQKRPKGSDIKRSKNPQRTSQVFFVPDWSFFFLSSQHMIGVCWQSRDEGLHLSLLACSFFITGHKWRKVARIGNRQSSKGGSECSFSYLSTCCKLGIVKHWLEHQTMKDFNVWKEATQWGQIPFQANKEAGWPVLDRSCFKSFRWKWSPWIGPFLDNGASVVYRLCSWACKNCPMYI